MARILIESVPAKFGYKYLRRTGGRNEGDIFSSPSDHHELIAYYDGSWTHTTKEGLRGNPYIVKGNSDKDLEAHLNKIHQFGRYEDLAKPKK